MPIRRWFMWFAVSLVAGCAPPAQKNVYFIAYTLRVESGPATAGSFTPASTVVLYDEQFVQPFTNVAMLYASIAPSPPSNTSITWTSSDPSIVVQQQANFATPAPTAPPFATFVTTGKTYGKSMVLAAAGAPVVQTASVTIYHYPSLSFGCRFRYSPAFTYDSAERPLDQTSDLYDTIGSDQLGPLDPCLNSTFATAPGTPEVWHVPYGGTLLHISSLTDFTGIQASQWRSDATQFPAQDGSVLLFKTKGDLIVKALLPVGPYEVSNADGTFAY